MAKVITQEKLEIAVSKAVAAETRRCAKAAKGALAGLLEGEVDKTYARGCRAGVGAAAAAIKLEG